jgi:hypothetical protein
MVVASFLRPLISSNNPILLGGKIFTYPLSNLHDKWYWMNWTADCVMSLPTPKHQ